MRRTPITAVIPVTALTALALTLAACGGSSGGSSTQSSTTGGSPTPTGEPSAHKTVAGESVNFKGAKNVTGMKSVDVEANTYYFEPSVLFGTPGQRITLHIDNESSIEHNFTITTEHVDRDIEAGKEVAVTVTVPSSGIVGFFCEYHRPLGMAGGVAVKGASLSGGGAGGTGGGASTPSPTDGYHY